MGLLLPVGRTLSERILLLGTCALGWNCMLWWLPFAEGRATATLAVLAATVGGLVAWELTAKRSLAFRLLPQMALPDLFPLAAAVASILSIAPIYLRPDSTSQLAALLPGWDNSAHYSMFASIWKSGLTQDAVAPPSGELWNYARYPQAFHATAASVATLFWPDAPSAAPSLVTVYSHACVLIVAISTMVLVAGLTSIPNARRGSLPTLALSAALVSAFSLGPGLTLHLSGFTAFWLPCVLASCSIFIAIQWTRADQIAHAAAMLGVTVAIAHAWVLLLTFSLPVLGSAVARLSIQPLSRHPWRSVTVLALTCSCTFAVLRAVALLAGNHIGALATGGAISVPNPLVTAALPIAASVCLSHFGSPLIARFMGAPPLPRVNLLQTALLFGVLSAAFIAVVQIMQGSFPSYYFWKYLTGLSLFSLTLLVAVVACSPKSTAVAAHVTTHLRPVFGMCAVLLGVLGGILPAGNPVVEFRTLTQASKSLETVANGLLTNVGKTGSCTPAGFVTSPSTMNPMNADQWYNALRGEWTQAANASASTLQPKNGADSDMPRVISGWLGNNPDCLLVPSNLKQQLHNSLRAEERTRLLTW